MFLKSSILSGIKEGRITLAFHRWKKPTVKSNGSLMTAYGQLLIKAVEVVDQASLSEENALSAGYASRAELIDELNKRKDGDFYRIELGELKADPRIALRETMTSERELGQLSEKLQRMDARSKAPWTKKVLQLIRSHPGVRAADLSTYVNQEKMVFKANVRKLKNLGLTESLDTGYRLSPRGLAYLKHLY